MRHNVSASFNCLLLCGTRCSSENSYFFLMKCRGDVHEPAVLPASGVTVYVRMTLPCLLSSAAVDVRYASVPSRVSVDARIGLSAHVSRACWSRCEIGRYFSLLPPLLQAVLFFANNVPTYFKRCTNRTRRNRSSCVLQLLEVLLPGRTLPSNVILRPSLTAALQIIVRGLQTTAESRFHTSSYHSRTLPKLLRLSSGSAWFHAIYLVLQINYTPPSPQ